MALCQYAWSTMVIPTDAPQHQLGACPGEKLQVTYHNKTDWGSCIQPVCNLQVSLMQNTSCADLLVCKQAA